VVWTSGDHASAIAPVLLPIVWTFAADRSFRAMAPHRTAAPPHATRPAGSAQPAGSLARVPSTWTMEATAQVCPGTRDEGVHRALHASFPRSVHTHVHTARPASRLTFHFQTSQR
jgi:hypothetical protein